MYNWEQKMRKAQKQQAEELVKQIEIGRAHV